MTSEDVAQDGTSLGHITRVQQKGVSLCEGSNRPHAPIDIWIVTACFLSDMAAAPFTFRLEEFKNDILIVAGDLGDTFNAIKCRSQ